MHLLQSCCSDPGDDLMRKGVKGTCNGHSMDFEVVSSCEIKKGKGWISKDTMIVEACEEEVVVTKQES